MAKIKKIYASISLENINGPDSMLIYKTMEQYSDDQVSITWYQYAGKVYIKVYDLSVLQTLAVILPKITR